MKLGPGHLNLGHSMFGINAVLT